MPRDTSKPGFMAFLVSMLVTGAIAVTLVLVFAY
jgi:hypothetical protein